MDKDEVTNLRLEYAAIMNSLRDSVTTGKLDRLFAIELALGVTADTLALWSAL